MKKRKGLLDKECILCKIAQKNKDFDQLEILRSQFNIVTVNLFPYNPGHIMIFPIRHLVSFEEMTKEEYLDLQFMTNLSLKILRKIYNPGGFNIGYNIGKAGGASISHIHQHIVPRYEHELGFVDIFSGSKIIIETPWQIYERLVDEFKEEFKK
ncbi:MAG: HIT domain-containing protein [Candidatus Muirbacterium halophilum]|nr:HIT domain-containing protein [Candidatus Muirbacterium halophilum]